MTSRSLEQVAAAVRSLHLTVAALRIEQLHRGGLPGPELDHVAAAELIAIIEVLIGYLEGEQWPDIDAARDGRSRQCQACRMRMRAI